MRFHQSVTGVALPNMNRTTAKKKKRLVNVGKTNKCWTIKQNESEERRAGNTIGRSIEGNGNFKMWTHRCNGPTIYSKPCLDWKVLPNNPTLESPWLQMSLEGGRIFSLHAMSKRKAHPGSLSATKKIKVQHGSLDDLPWKSVARPVETGLDGDDGILELEEVDNVEVVYEEKDGGKVVKFNVRSPSPQVLQLRLICPNLRQVLQLPAVGEPSAAGVELPASLTEHSQPPATASFDGMMFFFLVV